MIYLIKVISHSTDSAPSNYISLIFIVYLENYTKIHKFTTVTVTMVTITRLLRDLLVDLEIQRQLAIVLLHNDTRGLVESFVASLRFRSEKSLAELEETLT